jgi:uncharacterized protein YjbJ (UPF0337 family)
MLSELTHQANKNASFQSEPMHYNKESLLMTIDKAQNEWTELKGKIKARWSKFADTDVESFKGNMHLISDKIQKAYGYTKDKAEQEYKEFTTSLAPTVSVAEKAKPI